MIKSYEGELQFPRNSFINDPTHNTLQADLYDSSKAEVLGRIETSALANFDTDWDWSTGHFLVVIWPMVLPTHVEICPYGDYYDAYETTFDDGDVQVYETFVNPLALRDGTTRDVASNNIEVVLDVRHDYDLDVEDITELLVFRIAMVPKTWQDAYGDWITKTAEELAVCLNAILNKQAKVDGSLRTQNKKKQVNKKKWSKKPAGVKKPTAVTKPVGDKKATGVKKPAGNKKPAGGKKPSGNNKNRQNKWKSQKHTAEGWKAKQEQRRQRLAQLNRK